MKENTTIYFKKRCFSNCVIVLTMPAGLLGQLGEARSADTCIHMCHCIVFL